MHLYTVPAGESVEPPADAATVIDTVALGRIRDRDVLVTGSKGGVLAVRGVAPSERIAVLTVDDPISRVHIAPDGTITAGSGVALCRVELIEP